MINRHFILFLILLNIVFVAVWVGGFMYIQTKAAALELALGNSALASRSVDDVARMRRELKATSEMRAEFDQFVLTTATTPDFLESLTSLAGRSGVAYELTTLDSSNVLKISLQAKGTFEAVLGFQTALSKLPFKISFDHVMLSKIEAEKGSVWTLETTMIVKSFKP